MDAQRRTVLRIIYTVGHKKKPTYINVCKFVNNQRILMSFLPRDAMLAR